MTVARRGTQVALSAVAVSVLLGFGLPNLTGTAWGPIGEQVELLTLAQLTVLVGLWLLGLYAHTFLATAALPELTHRRALALNFSGSAVSNLVPFGGALGMGVTYAMLRSWGHERGFASFTALTTFWNVLTKLALPLVAVAGLVAAGALPTPGMARGAEVAAGLLLTLLIGVVVVLVDDRSAGLAGRAVQPLVDGGLRLARSSRQVDCPRALRDLRIRVLVLLRRRWQQMLLGMTMYAVLQATLLWLILYMLGSQLGVISVFAGFSFGRLLSLLVVLPGGVGLAEIGTAALLVALGGDATTVAAGALIYTAITFALEIPVGGVCGLLWWFGHRRRRAVVAG